MRFIGNVLWMLFCGILLALLWFLFGLLWSVTIIGIPVGVQCFKFASLSFCPFGKDVRFGGGILTTPVNILWLIISGWELALASTLNGIALCVTIVGIPWGLQCFKLARLAIMPFGAEIIHI